MTWLSRCELHRGLFPLFSPAFLFSQDSRQPIIPSDLFKEDGRERGQKLLSSRCVSRVSCFPEMGGSDGVGSFQSFLLSEGKKKESGWIGTLWWRSGLAHGRPWVLHPQHKGKNKKLLRRSVSHSGFVVFGSKGCLYCPGWPRTHDPPASASRIQPTVSRDLPALSLSGTGEVKRLPEVQSDPLLHPERGSASTRLGRNTAIRLLY